MSEGTGEQAGSSLTRACTCHPDDRPPVCHHKHALTDCLAAEKLINDSIHASARLRMLLLDAGFPWPHNFVDCLEALVEATVRRDAHRDEPPPPSLIDGEENGHD